MNFQSFFKFLKIFFVFFMLFVCFFSWSQEKIPIEQKLNFSSPESIPKTLESIKNPDILIISLSFDPYGSKILDDYLPEGYITINGEYDTNELIFKSFLNPILDNENIKMLILDLSSFLQNPSQQRVFLIKTLLEKIASYLSKNRSQIVIGLKFKYTKNMRVFIDQFFSYTEIPLIVKGIQIESGYEDFLTQKSYLNYLGNLKYLNLSANVIGTKEQEFDNFLYHLKKLKNLEILNLSDNAIGSLNGNLKLLGNQIQLMPSLQYLNLENNLIGVYKKDAQELNKSIQQIKHIVVSLNHNLN